MASEGNPAELSMDPATLYREEIYTDRRIGTIRVLTPVTGTGATDASRAVLFVGEAQILTPAGVLPLAFDLEATSLADAVEKFGAGARQALDRAVRELQEYRREAASSIVIPDRMPGGLGGPGGFGGPGGPLGGPGGPRGKIQLP
jgi:hypothetical protein